MASPSGRAVVHGAEAVSALEPAPAEAGGLPSLTRYGTPRRGHSVPFAEDGAL